MFTETDLIYVYTRAQALEDGVLIDVTSMARWAGLRYPTAVTAALWADLEAIPVERQGVEDITGRLWDLVRHARAAIRLAPDGNANQVIFTMPLGDDQHYGVKAICGPGDAYEPVLTIMRPDED